MPTLPTDPKERKRLFFVVAVIAVCMLWLAWYIPSLGRPDVAQVPNSAAVIAMKEINDKLIAENKYADVGVGLLSEKPLRLAVDGAVFSKQDLDTLPQYLRSINAEAEYEINVIVLKK